MIKSIYIFALVLSSFSVLGDHDVMDQRCNPVGTKSITISWKFSPAQTGKLPLIFKVYFCKNQCLNTSIDYHLGCAVNFTKGKSEYNCNIGKALALDFPQEYGFNYYVEEDGSPLVMRCPVGMDIQCPKPTDFKVRPSGEGKVMVNWPPPKDMGKSGDFLCYIITYFNEESPDKKVHVIYEDSGLYGHELTQLRPNTRYHFLLQCALGCSQKKSLAAGPVIAMTQEEEPRAGVIFQDWQNKYTAKDYTRNVTVILKIPDKDKWNGQVRKIRVFCYRNDNLCQNITLEEVSPYRRQYNATFPFLMKNTTYHIKADYCNRVGCSPPSRNLTILPLPADTNQIASIKKPNKSFKSPINVVGIAVGVAVAVVLLMIAMGLIIFKKYCRAGSRRNLEDEIGSLSSDPSELHHGGEETEEQVVYSVADGPAQRRQTSTLNPETTDFQSASVRSINSFNSIGGLADQSTIRNDVSASIRNGEKGSNEESVRLLQRSGSPSLQHKLKDNSLLPAQV